MYSELYEEELAALRAQLAAQSCILAEKAQQVESLRAELSEMGDASVEKVRGLEAELERVRERLAASEAKGSQEFDRGWRTCIRVLKSSGQKTKAVDDIVASERARVEAEFEGLRAELIANEAYPALESGTNAAIVALDVIFRRLMGGGA